MTQNPTPRAADEARSADTREKLLSAARRCVRDHGLAGATSRQITQTAGVNLAAITYHFGSKDELVAEALFSDLERRISPVLELFDETDEPAEALLRAVQVLLAEFERSRPDTLLYLETLFLATRDARYRRSARRLSRDVRSRLRDHIAALIEQGTIPTWIEPEAMSALILAVANGIALQTCLDPTGPDAPVMAGQFAGLLLAVAAPPPP